MRTGTTRRTANRTFTARRRPLGRQKALALARKGEGSSRSDRAPRGGEGRESCREACTLPCELCTVFAVVCTFSSRFGGHHGCQSWIIFTHVHVDRLIARIIVMPSFASCTVLLMVMCIYAMASRRRACVGLDTVRLRVSRARARASSGARCRVLGVPAADASARVHAKRRHDTNHGRVSNHPRCYPVRPLIRY